MLNVLFGATLRHRFEPYEHAIRERQLPALVGADRYQRGLDELETQKTMGLLN